MIQINSERCVFFARRLKNPIIFLIPTNSWRYFKRICYVYVFNQISIVQMSINNAIVAFEKVGILRSVATIEHLSLITIYILVICLSALNYYIFCLNITNLWCLPNIVVIPNVSRFGFVSLLRLSNFCHCLCHSFPFTSLLSAFG